MNSHRLIILDALSSEKRPLPPSPASVQRGSYWGTRCRPQQLSTTAEDHLEETLDPALSCNSESYLAPVSTLVPLGAISAFNLLRIISPNELKFSATITKAPGPPITLLR